MNYHIRIARPVADLSRTQKMYCNGLKLSVIGHFENHEGFSGIMLGSEGMQYHFEFTVCHNHLIVPSSTAEDLIVIYIPDSTEFQSSSESMIRAGFQKVDSLNPFWDIRGHTFQDKDGYRIVLQNGEWQNVVQ